MGFVFIPIHSSLLSSLPSLHMRRATAMNAQCTLKPSVIQIYTALPLFPLPISPLHACQRVQCKAYEGRTRLGCFPCSLCHQKSLRYTPLTASLQPQAFFKERETVALALLPANLFWKYSAGLFFRFGNFKLNDACFNTLEVYKNILLLQVRVQPTAYSDSLLKKCIWGL